MRIKLLYCICCQWILIGINAQEKMEIEGALKIGESATSSPEAGTIRWSGADFEGWNGSAWISLTGNAVTGSVTDTSNNTYQTIRIGNQVWMAENLRTSKLNDGGFLYHGSSYWPGLGIAAWCRYGNDSSNETTYGKLYNWAAVNTGKLCPMGWQVPDEDDWNALRDYLGGAEIAGGKLKEAGLEHWNSPNLGATNEVGFTGQPSGYRRSDGDFINQGYYGYWWSRSEATSLTALYFYLSYNDKEFVGSFINKTYGHPVRCIKD